MNKEEMMQERGACQGWRGPAGAQEERMVSVGRGCGDPGCRDLGEGSAGISQDVSPWAGGLCLAGLRTSV